MVFVTTSIVNIVNNEKYPSLFHPFIDVFWRALQFQKKLMINRRALFKNVNKADSLYEPTTAYPTAGPKPNMNSSNPVALPSSGTGMHSLIIVINNGVNIVPHTPEIDYVVMISSVPLN